MYRKLTRSPPMKTSLMNYQDHLRQLKQTNVCRFSFSNSNRTRISCRARPTSWTIFVWTTVSSIAAASNSRRWAFIWKKRMPSWESCETKLSSVWKTKAFCNWTAIKTRISGGWSSQRCWVCSKESNGAVSWICSRRNDGTTSSKVRIWAWVLSGRSRRPNLWRNFSRRSNGWIPYKKILKWKWIGINCEWWWMLMRLPYLSRKLNSATMFWRRIWRNYIHNTMRWQLCNPLGRLNASYTSTIVSNFRRKLHKKCRQVKEL